MVIHDWMIFLGVPPWQVRFQELISSPAPWRGASTLPPSPHELRCCRRRRCGASRGHGRTPRPFGRTDPGETSEVLPVCRWHPYERMGKSKATTALINEGQQLFLQCTGLWKNRDCQDDQQIPTAQPSHKTNATFMNSSPPWHRRSLLGRSHRWRSKSDHGPGDTPGSSCSSSRPTCQCHYCPPGAPSSGVRPEGYTGNIWKPWPIYRWFTMIYHDLPLEIAIFLCCIAMFNFQRLNHEGISWKLASPQPCEHYWREYQPLMPLWSVPNIFAKNPRSNHTRLPLKQFQACQSQHCVLSASKHLQSILCLHHLIPSFRSSATLLFPTSQVSCCFLWLSGRLAQPSISTSSILFQSITSSTAFMMSLGIPSAAAARPGDGLRLRLPVDLAAGTSLTLLALIHFMVNAKCSIPGSRKEKQLVDADNL